MLHRRSGLFPRSIVLSFSLSLSLFSMVAMRGFLSSPFPSLSPSLCLCLSLLHSRPLSKHPQDKSHVSPFSFLFSLRRRCPVPLSSLSRYRLTLPHTSSHFLAVSVSFIVSAPPCRASPPHRTSSASQSHPLLHSAVRHSCGELCLHPRQMRLPHRQLRQRNMRMRRCETRPAPPTSHTHNRPLKDRFPLPRQRTCTPAATARDRRRCSAQRVPRTRAPLLPSPPSVSSLTPPFRARFLAFRNR